MPVRLDAPQTWTATQTFAVPNNQIAIIIQASANQGNSVIEMHPAGSTEAIYQLGSDGSVVSAVGLFAPLLNLQNGTLRADLFLDTDGAVKVRFPNGVVRVLASP